MTMPLPPPQQHHGVGPGYFMERVAAIGVAAAWQRHAKAKRGGGSAVAPANLADDPQYPASWDEYFGQLEAKTMIQNAMRRAVDRGEMLRHVLIANPEPGIGKTALAVLIARQLGTRCFTISGTPTKVEVDRLLASLRNGDVLFIDEIHRLVAGGKGKAEWLLHLLENNAVITPAGIRPLAITVIGATTDVGVLPETVIERFKVKPILERLSPNEACWLAQHIAEQLFPPLPLPEPEEIALFAHAADSNPRRIRTLLEYAVDQHYDPDGYNAEKVLDRARMTWDGLDWTMQRYLVVLQQCAGAMGEAQMRNLLQEASISYVERRLYDKGFVTFSKAGRVLTTEGTMRAADLIARGVDL